MIRLITQCLKLYILKMRWQQRIFIYDLEDEIDELAADGSPAAKLRIERINKRIRSERKLTLRPPDGDSQGGE